jgi:hypothetical protein
LGDIANASVIAKPFGKNRQTVNKYIFTTNIKANIL